MFIKWDNVYRIIEKEFNLTILKTEDIILEKRNYENQVVPLKKKIIINDKSHKDGVKHLNVLIEKTEYELWKIKVQARRYNPQIEYEKTVDSKDIFCDCS